MLKQLNMHNQLVIPRTMSKELGLEPHDYVDVRLAGHVIQIVPISIEPSFSSRELGKLKKLFGGKRPRKTLNAEQFKRRLNAA